MSLAPPALRYVCRIVDLLFEGILMILQVVSTVKRRLSKRRPARQCEDDQEGNQVTETFSSHVRVPQKLRMCSFSHPLTQLVNAEKKRTSIHVDAEQSDEDGDKTQQRTSGVRVVVLQIPCSPAHSLHQQMTPSKKNNRPRPRPVGRKRARADEDVPHSGSMTSRSTKARKTSSSANVRLFPRIITFHYLMLRFKVERMLRETPAAGSSKSVNKVKAYGATSLMWIN